MWFSCCVKTLTAFVRYKVPHCLNAFTDLPLSCPSFLLSAVSGGLDEDDSRRNHIQIDGLTVCSQAFGEGRTYHRAHLVKTHTQNTRLAARAPRLPERLVFSNIYICSTLKSGIFHASVHMAAVAAKMLHNCDLTCTLSGVHVCF